MRSTCVTFVFTTREAGRSGDGEGKRSRGGGGQRAADAPFTTKGNRQPFSIDSPYFSKMPHGLWPEKAVPSHTVSSDQDARRQTREERPPCGRSLNFSGADVPSRISFADAIFSLENGKPARSSIPPRGTRTFNKPPFTAASHPSVPRHTAKLPQFVPKTE